MSAFPKIVGSRLFPKLFVFVLIEHQFFILIISLHPSVSYFYLFSFSYTIVISFKCTIKNQSAGRGGPPDGGGPHAMAQMAQWLIRLWLVAGEAHAQSLVG
jgi:hypothetical protein